MKDQGFVVPTALVDSLPLPPLDGEFGGYTAYLATMARIYDLGKQYAGFGPLTRRLTRRQRFRLWLSEFRWAIHDRLFPDCQEYED